MSNIRSRSLELTWHGPFTWSESYQVAEAQLAGLYVLAVPYGAAFVTYYLGETGKTIAERLMSHESMYRSGEFSLRDWDAFRVGVDRLLKPSFYRKYSPEQRSQFKANMDHWRPIVEAEIKLHRIFLLPIPSWSGKEHRALRMRLEQALGEDIAKGYPPDIPSILVGPQEYQRGQHDSWHRATLAPCELLVGVPVEVLF
ncbi:MAG: hypothetical protein HYR64_07215 [Fimbriimonas ginsengisoli]|uniref:Uncharacterized protein n=1 Tax=Fimbriimonas ginsengisoli TaxID=1005039 RepID=A0A931LSZ0_FIMGI|nr:hypothetical protein [Fimbriimonas ginsengisoli]